LKLKVFLKKQTSCKSAWTYVRVMSYNHHMSQKRRSSWHSLRICQSETESQFGNAIFSLVAALLSACLRALYAAVSLRLPFSLQLVTGKK
jgi:hypothetical protein